MRLKLAGVLRSILTFSKFYFVLSLVYFFYPSILHAGDVESVAEEGWVLVETPHFRVFSDAGERYANSFAVDMESFSRALPMFVTASLKEDISKLNVFALKDRSNQKILINSKDTAGLFITDNVDNYAIANLRHYSFKRGKQNYARQVLFHEYVHFYVANSHAIARVPVWYSEGMADFLSTILIEDEEISYGHVHEARMRGLNRAKSVPIEKLFEATEYPEGRREKSQFYDYAWLVYHFLFTHSEFAAKNQKYVKLLNGGSEEKGAFQESYGMTYKEFGKIIRSYFGDRFTAFTATLKEPWDLEIEQAREVSPAEISYEVGRLILARRSADQGKDDANTELGYGFVEYSLAHDPNNVAVQLELWSRDLEIKSNEGEGEFEALGAQITALIDRYPKRSDIVKHFGDWLSAQVDVSIGELDYEEAEKFALQARGKYRRALALDSSNKQVYLALGDLYGQHNRFLLNKEQEYDEYEAVLRELFYITSSRQYQFALALFFEHSDKKDEAIEEYRLLVKGGNNRLAKLANARLAALAD